MSHVMSGQSVPDQKILDNPLNLLVQLQTLPFKDIIHSFCVALDNSLVIWSTLSCLSAASFYGLEMQHR